MRPLFICLLMVLLCLSGVTQAQMPPAGPPNGGGAGRPSGPPPGGGGGGRPDAPPPPNGGPGGPGGAQPPFPNENNGAPGGQGGPGGPGGPGGNGNGGAGGATFPADYASSFLLYAVVDRPDNVTRLLYIDADSLAAMQTGEPLPDGTQLVIEAYSATPGADGRLVAGGMLPLVHVMERVGGQWRFGSFTTAGVPADRSLPDERPRACADCHNDTRGFVFTRPQLNAFATSGVTQYFFCGEAGREPCN